MKNKFLIPALALSASLVAFSGCKKEEASVTEKVAEQTKDAAASVTESVKAGTEKAVEKVKEGAEAVKAGAEKVVEKVKEEAKSLAPAPDGAQTIIDKAQGLVGEGKFQDALSALGGLSGMTLSDAQQKVVAGLKEQIQKGLAGAAGNLLGK